MSLGIFKKAVNLCVSRPCAICAVRDYCSQYRTAALALRARAHSQDLLDVALTCLSYAVHDLQS